MHVENTPESPSTDDPVFDRACDLVVAELSGIALLAQER